MADDKENDYQKLPTDDKCVHKIWKARFQGYEEALSLFNKIDDEKSPQWNKYLGLIKKFVTDSNAVAQEKGMEAALVFVENCGSAGKTTGEVMNGIVTKCIAAPKTKTKDLALQITLMYIEIEKQETVQEELIKGMDHKNPKIVAACVNACTQALRQFGNKVFAIKPLVVKIPVILTDRDKTVRDEGKALVVEMHRWIGQNIDVHLQALPQILKQELNDAFTTSGGPAKPTRYLKSQQKKIEAAREEYGDGGDIVDEGSEDPDPVDMDPYDMMTPVEILSKLPKDFYEKLEAKKWQERKEALDSLENILKNVHRLEPGDYADLVRALKKVISKDTNVMLVAEAGRLLATIASGLRNRFSPYAVACTGAILEKFKERKPNVVAALREAIDAIFPCTNLEAILEEVTEAFNNKNPSVKAEAALYLVRNWCKTQPSALNKKMLNAYTGGLLKLLDSADLAVRDAAAEAVGVALKLVGEKVVMPYIDKIDKLKIQKIKEFADKTKIEVKTGGRKKEQRAAPEPAASAPRAGSAQPKPVKRPGTGGAKKPPTGGLKKSASTNKANAKPQPIRELELSPEDVDELSDQLFGAQVMNGMADSNWKTRLSSVQAFASTVQGLGPEAATSQLLFKAINKKPGLKDTNFQVLKIKLDLIKSVAESFPLTITSVESILEDVVEKLGDAKCSASAAEALTALAEGYQLEPVVCLSLEYAMDKQKNPKVQAELFGWLSIALREFGFNININPLIAHSKKAVLVTNPAVRVAAISFLGVLSLYAGPSIIEHFDGEKAALKQQISLELDKYANDSPPPPTRGVSKSASKASILDTEEEEMCSPPDNEPDLDVSPEPVGNVGATDISGLITETLINELNDKNWKIRNDALDKVKSIITTSAPVKPALGELPTALAARLVDSNSKLAQTALSICQELGPALGTKCKQHAKIFLPNLFQAMGDSKALNRAGALQCVEAWANAAGSSAIALQDEILLDALKRSSPAGRQEIFGWLTDSLPQVPSKSFPKEELAGCVPLLFQSLEDRNSEVRKKASDCVLSFMLHLGYDAMHRQMEKLKPASKAVVLAALDKARPNLPVQPLPGPSKQASGTKVVKSGGAQKKEPGAGGGGEKKIVGKVKGVVKPVSARAKKEEEETGALLPQNNHKNQRIIDDQKLKVLKWNFTIPREEFFELLKDQMTVAGVSKTLIGNMFHPDFRYHLKALESLTEDLNENGDALICNLDLILKWLTLRFFDTNPSVILKGLEYLSSVFTYLISVDYTMAEYEAGCFIPYLVLKVGDPKDSVRNGVKALFKQICVVYSVTKLFGYLMEGLKSKNARQRAECLECICHLMECYGSSVMSPSPQAACKELARHIADRDNGVRSAALNAVTCAYFLEGERVYKMIGQISDKDLSLLEERIKRAAKTRSADNRKSMLLPLTSGGKQLVRPPSENNIAHHDDSKSPIEDPDRTLVAEDEEKESPPPPQPVIQVKEQAIVSGPFGLDPKLMEKLDSVHAKLKSVQIKDIDISFLDEPIKRPVAPTFAGLQSPVVSRVAPTMKFQETTDDTLVADTIHSIGSPDLNVAIRSISLLHSAIDTKRGALLGARGEEQLLRASAAQLRLLRARISSPETFSAHRYLISLINDFYDRGLGCSPMASSAAVGALLPELLRLMCTEELHSVQPGTDLAKLKRILNSVCVKLLDSTDKTTLVCTMIGSLRDSIAGDNDVEHTRYRELLMKCFWKVLKAMQTWDVNALDYDSVLYKVHLFNKEYPNSYWKRQSSIPDTPYRTIKTLVHAVTKIKGPGILHHLSQLPEDAELFVYIQRLLRVLEEKKENIFTEAPAAPSQSKLSMAEVKVTQHNNAVSEELAHILRKISEKEHAGEAMMQLYQLRERNPSVDIWSYMQDSSVFLKNYIEKGLKEIAEKKKYSPAPTIPMNTVTMDVNNDNVVDYNAFVDHYRDKLKQLRARAGLPELDTVAKSPVTDNKNAYMDSVNENNRGNNYDPHLEFHPTQPLSQRNEGEVDAIRQRLQQIKQKR